MNNFVRGMLAGLAGIVVAMVTVALLETIGHMAFPPPGTLDPSDPEKFREFVAQLPPASFAIVLAAWFAAAFLGTFVAIKIARSRPMLYAAVVGGVLLVAIIANVIAIPHPTWFTVVAVVGTPAAAILAALMAGKRAKETPNV